MSDADVVRHFWSQLHAGIEACAPELDRWDVTTSLDGGISLQVLVTIPKELGVSPDLGAKGMEAIEYVVSAIVGEVARRAYLEHVGVRSSAAASAPRPESSHEQQEGQTQGAGTEEVDGR